MDNQLQLEIERWTAVADYFGLYTVSSKGRIMGLKSCKVLKAGVNPVDGRLVVNLSKEGKTKSHAVHVIVAKAFVPNPDNKPWVLHKDGNHQNNEDSNLYWGTPKENSEDMVKHGNSLKGEKNPNTHLTAQDIHDIREFTGKTRILAEKYGMSSHAIRLIQRRKTWTHV